MTKAELQNRFNGFLARWIGRRVDTDGAPKGAVYQCVDIAKLFLNEALGVPYGAYGNAIDWWYHTASAVLAKTTKIATTNVEKGDIVIFRGINGNPYGHIGVATGNQTSSMVEVVEQNGSTGTGNGLGGNAIRTRYITKSRVPGILRPKTSSPAPAPQPSKMPPVGSKIQLIPVVTRTTYRAGTTTVAGTIRVTGNDFIYLVRGYDPKFQNRVLINSKSAGGNGVSLALFFVNGVNIGNWKVI